MRQKAEDHPNREIKKVKKYTMIVNAHPVANQLVMGSGRSV
jgi:hypothetical protein